MRFGFNILRFAQAHDSQYSRLSTDLDLPQHVVDRPLNIAVISETWPPEINGVALSVLQLVKGLQQRGHRILLVRPAQQQACQDFIPEQVCLVRAQSIPKYDQLNFGWPQIFKIGMAFERFKPDVVHIVTEGPLGLAAMNQAKRRNIAISSGFHSSFHDFSRYYDLAFLQRPVQHYLRWFHNNTQLTCVPSPDSAQLLREFGIDCPLKVIGRGVDGQRFHRKFRDPQLRARWQVAEDCCVILAVGRVSAEKNLPLMFASYRQLLALDSAKYQLVVVGDGPCLAAYQADYPEVIFMGLQRGDDLAACYASSDVFVFASLVETFGNVVLEAMASGLPVLAFDYACAHQMLQQDQSGWLIPYADEQAWQQQFLHLPELMVLRQMGERAMQHACAHGWDQPIHDFEQALLQLEQGHHAQTMAQGDGQ